MTFVTDPSTPVTFGVAYTDRFGRPANLPKGGSFSEPGTFGVFTEVLDATGAFVVGILFTPNGTIGVVTFTYATTVGISVQHTFDIDAVVTPTVTITDPAA